MITPYPEWECYKAGMYDPRCDPDQVIRSHMLLAGADKDIKTSMLETLRAWPETAKAIVTTGIAGNPRSWLGQATCSREVGSTAIETRHAWGLMYPWEQDLADECAEQAIDIYTREVSNGQQNLLRTERS